MHIDIPKNAENIIRILNENGFEAYVVGGCVRDSLLNKEPEDWDITTSARPEDVKRIFTKTIDTGIQHGTVTVRMGGQGYEVTTYRIDGEYEDSRHPKSVEFTSNLSEDLKRRDFTINAMAYSPKDGLIDIFDGVKDLENGIIRCVGNPKERFDEDALRTLRAVRFAGQLKFEIEDNTFEAIKYAAKNIKNVSAERIRVELTKLIMSEGVDRLITAKEALLTEVCLPEWDKMLETNQDNPHHMYNVGVHTIKVLEGVNRLYKGNDERVHRILCWSALLHDVAKPECKSVSEDGIGHFYGHPDKGSVMATNILKRLKFDNYTINMVSRLVKYHDYPYDGSKKALRRFLNKAGIDIVPFLLILMEADVRGQSEYKRDIKLNAIKQLENDVNEIKENLDAITIKDLAINGNDLMEIGVPSGKMIGTVLESLLNEVLDTPSLNDREILLEKVKKMCKI